MKMRVEVDMTPEELRRFLGMPDLSELQQAWLARFQEQVGEADLDKLDPAALMKPLLANNAAAMEAFSRAFWSAFAGASAPADADKPD